MAPDAVYDEVVVFAEIAAEAAFGRPCPATEAAGSGPQAQLEPARAVAPVAPSR